MKNIKVIILGILISFFIGYFMLNSYNTNKQLLSKEDIIYAFVYGKFNKEEYAKKIIDLKKYILEIDSNDNYIIYLGLTKSKKNINKLKEFFDKKNYNISVEEIYVDDKKLISLIESCDTLLEKVENIESIEVIENKILDYKEV